MNQQLERRFEKQHKAIGLGTEEVRGEMTLSRIVRVTDERWEMEADQRHAEILIEHLNLQGAAGVVSPYEGEITWENEENLLVMGTQMAESFAS